MARITTRTARMGACGTLDGRAPHTSTNVLRGAVLLLICIKSGANDTTIWPADAVLVLRTLIALFIVGGLVAIWVRVALGWQWVHEPLLRLMHLVAIGMAAAHHLLS
ncbi:hypothetical protein OKW38_001964 [Paraburkholderia sp. MM5496-R1]